MARNDLQGTVLFFAYNLTMRFSIIGLPFSKASPLSTQKVERFFLSIPYIMSRINKIIFK